MEVQTLPSSKEIFFLYQVQSILHCRTSSQVAITNSKQWILGSKWTILTLKTRCSIKSHNSDIETRCQIVALTFGIAWQQCPSPCLWEGSGRRKTSFSQRDKKRLWGHLCRQRLNWLKLIMSILNFRSGSSPHKAASHAQRTPKSGTSLLPDSSSALCLSDSKHILSF